MQVQSKTPVHLTSNLTKLNQIPNGQNESNTPHDEARRPFLIGYMGARISLASRI
jgi:hypothetical protein